MLKCVNNYLWKYNGNKLVINDEKEKSREQEISDIILSILYVNSRKKNGKRTVDSKHRIIRI